METTKKKFAVDIRHIGFIKFIFEAHEGVAVVSTADMKEGIIKLSIAPDMMTEAALIIGDLQRGFGLYEI